MWKSKIIWSIVILLFSCRRNERPHDIYNPKFYRRVTSQADSSKNMYVIYNSTIDTSYNMFRFYWDNGRYQTINYFHKNKKDGPWVGYYEDGKFFFKDSFFDGKMEGEHREYFMNGKLQISGTYHHDLKFGIWKYYKEDGSLIKVENYK